MAVIVPTSIGENGAIYICLGWRWCRAMQDFIIASAHWQGHGILGGNLTMRIARTENNFVLCFTMLEAEA